MAGPVIKMLMNAAAMGAGVVGKAFAKAYQQASIRGGAAAAEEAPRAAASGSLAQRLSKRIRAEEARQILNVKKESSPAEVQQAYERLFAANEVSKGGSFYLQSKIFRSRQALEEELKLAAKSSASAASSSGSAAAAAAAKNPFMNTRATSGTATGSGSGTGSAGSSTGTRSGGSS